jgi:hypothetical protein
MGNKVGIRICSLLQPQACVGAGASVGCARSQSVAMMDSGCVVVVVLLSLKQIATKGEMLCTILELITVRVTGTGKVVFLSLR